MKKIFSLFLLFVLISGQFQIGGVYAENLSALEKEKETQTQVIEKLEEKIEGNIESFEKKAEALQIEEKLEKKSEEISQYLQDVQERIEGENSRSDIREIVQEAKKVVVLKLVSGTTPDQDISEALPAEIQNNSAKKEMALETIQDSMQTTSGDYSIIVKTQYSQEKVEKLFHSFDSETRIEFLYENNSLSYFEVFLGAESVFKQEMMADISNGILPESFLGIEVVLPEVFTLSETTIQSGENLSSTWGIEQYKAYNYLTTENTNNPHIKVGVVDTGIDASHPDLVRNVFGGYDFVNEDSDPSDDQGHGTHVAGTIAAQNNGSGIIGVNPGVDLVPLKICNASGFCPSYAVLRALDYALQNDIDILNMSLGGRGVVAGNPICDGIAAVSDAGTIVVAAAGNSNIDTSNFVPGGCPASLTVGAFDKNLQRASFSNYGNKVDVAAPGVGIYSTYPLSKGSYKQLSGTSMATPHIVGLVSLMKQKDPSLTLSGVRTLFGAHPITVHSDAQKYIASGVDVEGLFEDMMSQITLKNTLPLTPTTVTEEQIETPPTLEKNETEIPQKDTAQTASGETLELIATRDETLIPKENTTQAVIIDETQLRAPQKLEAEPSILELGDKDESVVINSVENITQREEILSLSQETTKNYAPHTGSQVFDATGKKQSEETQINAAGPETPGFPVGADFDYMSLPQRETPLAENMEINNSEEAEHKEIFIDGAEKGVEINSSEEPVWQEVILSSELPKEEAYSLDREYVWVPIEDLHYEPQKEIFIDGAEKGVEINSSEDPVWQEVGENGEIFSLPKNPEDGVVFGGEVATPEGFVQNPENDALLEEEGVIIPEYTEYNPEVEDVLQGEDIGVQDTFNCTIMRGMTCSFYIRYSSNYTITVENPSIVSHYSSSRYLYVKGLNPGTSVYRLYTGTTLSHTIYINVTPPPITQDVHIALREGEDTTLYFPSNSWAVLNADLPDAGRVDTNVYWPNVRILGRIQGNVILHLRDSYGNDMYNIYVKIIGPAPIVQQYQVWETRQLLLNSYYHNISMNRSDIIGIGEKVGNYFYTTGLKAGVVEIYIKDYYGRHLYTYEVTVLPKPSLQTYTTDIYSGGSLTYYLPEDISNYSISGTGDSIYDSLQRYNNSFSMSTRTVGSYTVIFSDSNNFERYRVTVNSLPQREYHTLNVTDRKPVWYNSLYNFNELNTGIVGYRTKTYPGSEAVDGFLEGIGVGSTEIHITKDGGLRKIWHISVNPIPTPQEIACTVEVGYDCIFSIENDGYYFSESKSGISVIDANTNRLKIRGISSGDITVYVDSPLGNYVTHILRVHVTPKPPKITQCETAVGLACESYIIEDIDQYTYSTNDPGVVSLMHNRIWEDPDGDGNYDRTQKATLKVTGLSQGLADVYVYKLGDHVATIQMDVRAAVSPITLLDPTAKIKESQKAELQIVAGGGNYSLVEVQAGSGSIGSNLTLSVDANTGKISLSGKKTGVYYPIIKDKYNQRVELLVVVQDVVLTLDEAEMQLGVGDMQYNSIYEYYDPITSLTVSGPIEAYMVRFEDGERSIKVKGVSSGTGTIVVRDGEGTEFSVDVTVGSGIAEDISRVRYIRDWAKGSNRNQYSHWIELQALEKGSGINRALGKTVTSLVANQVGYEYSKVVDGITLGNNYAEATWGQTNDFVVVDLGGLYDISTVKVWHYYPDTRTYYGTKTEVSADGVTWWSVFDSAVSGTYVEPLDGSGRSYAVVAPVYYEAEEVGNMVKNGRMNGVGGHSGQGGAWLGGAISSGWWSDVYSTLGTAGGRAELSGGRMMMEVAGNSGYVESRSTNVAHWGVSAESMVVEPNTEYVLRYEYETEYISGDSDHGFSMRIFVQESNGVPAGEWRSQEYIKTTQGRTEVVFPFTTSATAHYLNISPVIYGYTGSGTLKMKAWLDDVSLVRKDNLDISEIDALVNEVFGELGVQGIQNVEEEVEINSLPTSLRCENGNSEKFWVRPYNGFCVDNVNGTAWSCNTGYKDMFAIDGTNTCVSSAFLKSYYIGHEASFKKLREGAPLIAEKYSYEVLETLQIEKNNADISSIKKSLYNYLFDELRNEKDKKTSLEYKKRQELKSWYRASVLASDNGKTWGPDGYITIPEYENKTRSDIAYYSQRFAEEMFEYQYTYDSTFRTGYNARVAEEKGKQEALFGTLTSEQIAQIAQGTKDGVITGTKDYVMQYYDLALSLSELKFENVYSGVKNSWNFVASSVTNLSATYDSFKSTITGIYDKVASLTYGDYAYGGSYVGTNIGLSAADPVGKVLTLAGGGFLAKISGKVDGLVLKRVNGIGERIGTKWGLFKCIEFADEFRLEMDKIGIKYEKIDVSSGLGNGSIWSDNLQTNIATNGIHKATKIGDTIYDNLYPKGISFSAWKNDLLVGQTGGAIINIIP